ncbi:alkaline phosphatase family protein, partial [bacterium]|nr:alkaline phosphatase family protein [bacterium]
SWIARSNDVWPSDVECLQSVLLHSPPDAMSQFRALAACVRQGARLRAFDQMAGATLRSMWGEDELSGLADRALSDVRLQTDVYLSMLDQHQPDVSAFVLYGSDQLGHRFWRFHEPNAYENSDLEYDSRYAHVIEDYYVAADRAFERIVNCIDTNCRIILVSDHGMKADSALPGQYFIHTDALLKILGFAGKVDHHFIERRWLIRAKPGEKLPLADVSKALANIRFPNGDEVFESSEEDGQLEVRTQFSMTANPQSPIERFDELTIGERQYPTEKIFFARYFSGEHDPKGIFLMSGPGVKHGQWIDHASLLDIAPTAMYWMGLPLSREIEGSVIEAAFDDEFLNQNEANWVEAYEPLGMEETLVPDANADVMERLR